MSTAMIAYAGIAFLLVELVFSAQVMGRDTDASLQSAYDYIVVGCGISGLVVTNRLSEDASVTVLCIEAGLADNYEPIIQDPVYVGADIGGHYDWNLSTTPQTQLDGATRPMPQGKVLGGGSILNAMCWNRGGKDDYDAWEALGNPGWNWEGLLPYFMKSETYTPVHSKDIARRYSINYNPAVHGTSGPVQVSYPKYFYPQSINLFAGLNHLGIPTQFDPNDGSSAGAAFVPTDLHPQNQTRSDARRTYFDPFIHRNNLHVITGQHVTRVLIDSVPGSHVVSDPGRDNREEQVSGSREGFGFSPEVNGPVVGDRDTRRRNLRSSRLRITGVEFAPNASAPRRTIFAAREVIVAAGALHSVQVLQLSGIGPASLLESLGIPLAVDLPGVGNNLQDHCLVGTFYPYNNNSYPSPADLTSNASYNAEAEIEYKTQKTGPWTAGSPNGLAFPPLPLISKNSASILKGAAKQEPTEHLASGLDSSVILGYTYQKNSLVRRLAEKTVAAYEIINNNAGSLTVSIMHPFSRGTCSVKSSNPFEPPRIDPRWLSNPVDRQVLIEALLFNRKILATPPMVELQAAQFVPPFEADEDALNQIINNGIRTEFHPSGTCAMSPLDKGGVVDSHLRVWGTENLRVVDASIFPLVPAAHLQAVVYGVAEKAADIIKADNIESLSNHNTSPSSYSATPASSFSPLIIPIPISTTSSTTSSHVANSFTDATVFTSPSDTSCFSMSKDKTSSNSLLPSSPKADLIIAKSHSSSLLTVVSSVEVDQTVVITVSIQVTKTVAMIPSLAPVETTTVIDTLRALPSSIPSPSPLSLGRHSPSLVKDVSTTVRTSIAVDALAPIFLKNAVAAAANPVISESAKKQEERQQQEADLANFIRWLLSYFDI